MIYLIHQNNKVLKAIDNKDNEIVINIKKSIANTLFDLAKKFPNEIIIWCKKEYTNLINTEELENIFHHKHILASYNLDRNYYIPEEIGFVDLSIYIKVNKKVCFPTWRMSSDVGGISSEVLNKNLDNFKKHTDFNYFINSIAKTAMPQGLFCYSEPNLLVNKPEDTPSIKQASNFTLFQFVKEHFKWNWIYLLFLSFVIYKRKFPLLPLIKSLFIKKRKYDLDFSKNTLQTSRKLINTKDVDVIIPTICRKKHLYNVLKDLSKQTILPKNVIIIEQNPKHSSVTELDYLITEEWPFNVKHKFIHETGVCNARNLAIGLVESEWVFFGDDDIRFDSSLIEAGLLKIQKLGVKSINFTCLQVNEEQTYFKTAQTPIFGSGTSIVKSELLKKINFDLRFEHGYREDSDFGMQIRNLGEDIVFTPDILTTHLKAPFGGFREKHIKPWEGEKYYPKPSPTVMLYNLLYFTKQQNLAYKLLLFIKFYKHQPIKNPFRYIKVMRKRWAVSFNWAQNI